MSNENNQPQYIDETRSFENKFKPGERDFRPSQQMFSLTNEYDVQSNFLQPHIKASETVGKGRDEDGYEKIGFIPTGMSELNTPDLQTAILDDQERVFINVGTALGTLLVHLKNTYNIDTSSSYDWLRLRIGTFNSTTKSKKGHLLDALTTKKFEQNQNVTSSEFSQKKKVLADELNRNY